MLRKGMSIKYVYGQVEIPNGTQMSINYVRGQVEIPNGTQMVSKVDFVEEYYKSASRKENKLSGMCHDLTTSSIEGIDDSLEKVLDACDKWQGLYVAKYSEFLNTNFRVRTIFFSRVDLIDPTTKQTQHFKDFSALAEYLKNPLLPENDPANFQQHQVVKYPSPHLSNNRSLLWKVGVVGLGMAMAVSATAVASSLVRKGP